MTETTSEKRGGAQIGNTNSITSGRRVESPDRYGLVIGTLGKRHETIYSAIKHQRRALEQAVIAQAGRISVTAAYAIDAACLYQMLTQILRKQIAEAEGRKGASSKTSDLIDLAGKIGWSIDKRNAAVNRLSLDSGGSSGGTAVDPMAWFDEEARLHREMSAEEWEKRQAQEATAAVPDADDSSPAPDAQRPPAATTERVEADRQDEQGGGDDDDSDDPWHGFEAEAALHHRVFGDDEDDSDADD